MRLFKEVDGAAKYDGGMRSCMYRSRHIRIPVETAQSPTHECGTRRSDGCMRSELRCRSGGSEFVGLGFSCHLVLLAVGLN